VLGLAKQLEKEGVKAATQAEAHRLTQQALAELDAAQAVGLASQALYQMTQKMSQRIQ
jgi:cell division septum initiation protein DivIVA